MKQVHAALRHMNVRSMKRRIGDVSQVNALEVFGLVFVVAATAGSCRARKSFRLWLTIRRSAQRALRFAVLNV